MTIARDTTAANIKPLEGAIIRRYTAGAAVAAGEIVSMQSDGIVDPSDSTSAAQCIVGVAVQAAAAAGDRSRPNTPSATSSCGRRADRCCATATRSACRRRS